MAASERFYVYGLIDPRDDSLFYVGKGTGARCKSHWREWRRGQVVNGRKFERIGEIGQEPSVKIFAEGLSEPAAFKLERELIALHRDTLTNVAKGAHSVQERLLTETRELLKRVKPLRLWTRERPRTATDVRLYRFVVSKLRANARALAPNI